MIISIDTEKTLDKNLIPFYGKKYQQIRNRIFLKGHLCKTHSLHSIVKRLKAFPLRLGIEHGYPLSPLLLNNVLDMIARAIREGTEIKDIQAEKKEVK